MLQTGRRRPLPWSNVAVSAFSCTRGLIIYTHIQGLPLPTKPGSSLIILLQTHSDTYRHNFTTDTFLFISHTTNLLLFKSRCNIFIGFGIIKELPGLVGSGTLYIYIHIDIYVYMCMYMYVYTKRIFLIQFF